MNQETLLRQQKYLNNIIELHNSNLIVSCIGFYLVLFGVEPRPQLLRAQFNSSRLSAINIDV